MKATGTVGSADLKGIEAFARAAGPRFHRGIVLYAGRETVPFSANVHALPLSALWQAGN